MKIAIITFSDMNTNYGSILQSYALKEYLVSLGHEVVFIKYREYNKYSKSLKGHIKFFLIKIYFTLYSKRFESRKVNFNHFILNNLVHTRLYTSNELMKMYLPNFDAYICGSDQIWNLPILGGLRKPYFLDFAPNLKPRIAYAPSLGEYKIDDLNREDFIESLANIDYISCRERKSVELLKAITDKSVEVVVDPVFLLSKEEWENRIYSTIPIPKGDYGLCYFVRRDSFAQKLVLYLKNKYKVPIYNVSDNLINVSSTSNEFATAPPDLFLKLLKNARFCVGTSFHLAAFSVIFNKLCYIAYTPHNEERISNLFSLVDKRYQLVKTLNQVDDIYDTDMKIQNVDDTFLQNEIIKSKSFLINAICKK